MTMIGTFLVRSGILTSVHAFAVDPERGTFILALLALYIGGALTCCSRSARHDRRRRAVRARQPRRRAGGQQRALSAILGIVLLGTLYPLLTEARRARFSVGPPYFNPVAARFR